MVPPKNQGFQWHGCFPINEIFLSHLNYITNVNFNANENMYFNNIYLEIACIYISFGIFKPINSMVCANVSRAIWVMVNRFARVFSSMSSRKIGQL